MQAGTHASSRILHQQGIVQCIRLATEPPLVCVQVEGKSKYAPGAGVRTRRQAAAQGGGEAWPRVPLPMKLMHVLVQLLQEADASAAAAGQDWQSLLFGEEGETESEGGDDEEAPEEATAAVESLVRAGICTLKLWHMV
jgi:hypothetical protein